MPAVTKRFVAKNGLDNNSNTITNVVDPVNAQDVATKNFVVTTANRIADGAYIPFAEGNRDYAEYQKSNTIKEKI